MDEPTDLLSFGENIQIDEEARIHFKDIIKWGKFVAITAFILVVLVTFLVYLATEQPGSALSSSGSDTLAGWIIIAICIIPEAILLYRFSVVCDNALATEDMVSLNRGLKALKVFFIISGIFGLIICFFTAISSLMR